MLFRPVNDNYFYFEKQSLLYKMEFGLEISFITWNNL